MTNSKHTTNRANSAGRPLPSLASIPDPKVAYDPAQSMETAARLRGEARYTHAAGKSQAAPKKKSGAKKAVATVAVLCVLGAGGFAAWQNLPQIQQLIGGGAPTGGASSQVLSVSDNGQAAEEGQAAAAAATPATPIIAQSAGVDLHCAVPVNKLTEILIHNASNAYALPITTQLEEANNNKVMKNHGTGRDASAQPTGDEWMTGQFIRCWREGNAGPSMSSIDCGAKAGTQVLSPVTGKVVLVKKYDLYGEPSYPDVRVHIQPDANANADVVLIHLTDVTIKAGDRVEAGVTPLAKVRNVYKYLGDQMQLRDYTGKGDNGNHTHICVNDKNHKDYHGLDDLKPKAKKKSDETQSEKSA